MRKRSSILLLTLLLLLSIASTVGAQSGTPPVGNCPTGFEPMSIADMPHEHMHAGLKVDLNGDGIICMKPVTDTIHVHVDNVIPTP